MNLVSKESEDILEIPVHLDLLVFEGNMEKRAFLDILEHGVRQVLTAPLVHQDSRDSEVAQVSPANQDTSEPRGIRENLDFQDLPLMLVIWAQPFKDNKATPGRAATPVPVVTQDLQGFRDLQDHREEGVLVQGDRDSLVSPGPPAPRERLVVKASRAMAPTDSRVPLDFLDLLAASDLLVLLAKDPASSILSGLSGRKDHQQATPDLLGHPDPKDHQVAQA